MGRGSGGGGRGGRLGSGARVKIGDTIYPRGSNAFRSRITRFISGSSAEVTLSVGGRAGQTFLADLSDSTLTPRR